MMEKRKKEIQDKFLKEMALRIDFPKPGFGSSNDGNTARRFFENYAKSAEITGKIQINLNNFIPLKLYSSFLKNILF